MTAPNGTIRKMIAHATQVDSPVFAGAGPCLNAAIGQVALDGFGIQAQFGEQTTGHSSLPDLLSAAPNPGLLVVLKLAGGRQGLAWLDPLLVNALIEVQTRAPDKSVLKIPRKPTLIDIALCGPIVQTILAAFTREMNKVFGGSAMAAMSIERHETDARQLAYALPAGSYGWVEGTLQFQEGIRGGLFCIALPKTCWSQGGQTGPVAADPAWRSKMLAAVMAAPCRMDAVLDVIEMPLGRALGLRVGDVLPLSPSALSDLKLRAVDGQTVFSARLGQFKAKKAVCLTGSTLVPLQQAAQPGADPAE